MTADENQIHKNTANTSSLTLRDCVMFFESKLVCKSRFPEMAKVRKKLPSPDTIFFEKNGPKSPQN